MKLVKDATSHPASKPAAAAAAAAAAEKRNTSPVSPNATNAQ